MNESKKMITTPRAGRAIPAETEGKGDMKKQQAIGKLGTSAAQMTTSRKWRRIIVSQPGYHRGAMMLVCKVAGRPAYRLYRDVCGRWMDASLKDIEA